MVYIAPFTKKYNICIFYSIHNTFKINISSCLILDIILKVKLQI